MSVSVYVPTTRERELARHLRSVCVAEIKSRDPETVCQQLGFRTQALERLLWEPDWDLRIAFRVSEGLNLPIADALLQSVGAHHSNGVHHLSASP